VPGVGTTQVHDGARVAGHGILGTELPGERLIEVKMGHSVLRQPS